MLILTEGSLIPEYPLPNVPQCSIETLLTLIFSEEDRICVNSEASLEILYHQLPEGRKKSAIDLMKDKYAFRQAIAPLFPEFYFSKVCFEEWNGAPVKSVLKPVKGFFSAGVRIVEAGKDCAQLKTEIREEMDRLGEYFSESILSQEEWLLEEYIEGDEIAVDMYYAADGTPVILNLLLHPMPQDLHYLNVLYWTSEELFRTWEAPVKEFFCYLNHNVLQVSNFPIHAEFRIRNGRLVPIELNPMRFGGFGLADLVYYGLGCNPYELFFQGKRPDWDAIWKERKGSTLAWLLAYNGKDVMVDIATLQTEKFLQFCGSDLLHYRPLDWRKQPVFGLAYLALNEPEKIDEILALDFNNFFTIPA